MQCSEIHDHSYKEAEFAMSVFVIDHVIRLADCIRLLRCQLQTNDFSSGCGERNWS